jgi:hypothetical protein
MVLEPRFLDNNVDPEEIIGRKGSELLEGIKDMLLGIKRLPTILVS